MHKNSAVAVEYSGIGADAELLLGALRKALVYRSFDKTLVRLELRDFIEAAFGEDLTYRLTPTVGGFRAAERKPPARHVSLLAEMKTKLGRRSFVFRYGSLDDERQAKRVKVFPWGIRGITAAGPRNFSWDKIHTATVPLAKVWRVMVKSTVRNERRVFSWELQLLGESGVWIKRPGADGSFETLISAF